MATQLDDKVKSLLDKSYPQAKDAGEDPAKLSSAIFSSVEVSTRPYNPSIAYFLTDMPPLVHPRREDRSRAMAHYILPHRLHHRRQCQDRRAPVAPQHPPLDSHHSPRLETQRG